MDYSASGGYWFSVVNASSLPDGEHVLDVRVLDVVGHETITQVAFVVRAVVPPAGSPRSGGATQTACPARSGGYAGEAAWG
jgi:hypothetical protein